MKNLQERIREFCEQHDLRCSAKDRMLDLVSEIGEVSKELLKSSDYGKKEIETNEDTKKELGDVLFSLLVLANELEIDLEAALEQILEKYEKRLKKGSAGSEVD